MTWEGTHRVYISALSAFLCLCTMRERRADCMSKQMGHFLVSSSYILYICAMQVVVLFKIKGKSYSEMCDTSISIFKSISISRLPLFRLRDRYQYWKCLITISISILILQSCHFDLDTDLDTYFVKISRQYQYDIDISAFLAIPTSISISNQSVSHIAGS